MKKSILLPFLFLALTTSARAQKCEPIEDPTTYEQMVLDGGMTGIPMGTRLTLTRDLYVMANDSQVFVGQLAGRDCFLYLSFTAATGRVLPAGTVLTASNGSTVRSTRKWSAYLLVQTGLYNRIECELSSAEYRVRDFFAAISSSFTVEIPAPTVVR